MSYQEAKDKYAAYGVDVEEAIETLKTVPVSLHCWQGDDVRGFDTDPNKPLTGGIQTTGNYPGRARTPEELMADLDKVLSLIPGTPKMNLHANYAIFEDGDWADRDLQSDVFQPSELRSLNALFAQCGNPPLLDRARQGMHPHFLVSCGTTRRALRYEHLDRRRLQGYPR